MMRVLNRRFLRMKKPIIILVAVSTMLSAGLHKIPVASSQSTTPSTSQTEEITGPFVKKRYSIQGEWSIIETDGQTQIKFSENFKTKGGPDLKVYLSQTPIEDLDSQAASSNTVSIGVLKSKSGGQIYTVPDDIDLTKYQSVIIHCEAFSVLWGGFNLPAPMTDNQ